MCCSCLFSENDAHFRNIPWLTEKAIVFLEDFLKNNPNAVILEFGSGSSTLWFAKTTKNLYSVEHDANWYKLTKQKLESDPKYHKVEYFLLKRPYYDICDNFPDEYFDLILVDGRNRKGCIAKALRILKPGGVLMLDNSERPYYKTVFSLMSGWPSVITEQKVPDKEGFFFRGWQTRWWYKPI